MAFKEITNSNRIDEYFPKKAADRKVGDFVVGEYKGTKENTRPDGETSVLYLLANGGRTIGVNASRVIDTKMSQVPVGATVKIQFNGKERSPKTGREYNDYSVFIDTDETAEEDKVPEPLF